MKTIICLSLFLFLLIAIFALHRNNWVFAQRTKVLDRSLEEYYKLPSYGTMCWKFWIWDINKFLHAEK